MQAESLLSEPPEKLMDRNLSKFCESEGQGILLCCSPWDHKEWDMTEPLNNSKWRLELLHKVTWVSDSRVGEWISITHSLQGISNRAVQAEVGTGNAGLWRAVYFAAAAHVLT